MLSHSLLLDAILKKDKEKISQLIGENPTLVDSVNPIFQIRPIEYAFYCGQLDIVISLVAKEATIFVNDSNREHAYGVLYWLCIKKGWEKTEDDELDSSIADDFLQLLEADFETYGLSREELVPAHIAAARGKLPNSEEEKSKADVRGLYPYHYAAMTGQDFLKWIPASLAKNDEYEKITGKGIFAGIDLAWLVFISGSKGINRLKTINFSSAPESKYNINQGLSSAHILSETIPEFLYGQVFQDPDAILDLSIEEDYNPARPPLLISLIRTPNGLSSMLGILENLALKDIDLSDHPKARLNLNIKIKERKESHPAPGWFIPESFFPVTNASEPKFSYEGATIAYFLLSKAIQSEDRKIQKLVCKLFKFHDVERFGRLIDSTTEVTNNPHAGLCLTDLMLKSANLEEYIDGPGSPILNLNQQNIDPKNPEITLALYLIIKGRIDLLIKDWEKKPRFFNLDCKHPSGTTSSGITIVWELAWSRYWNFLQDLADAGFSCDLSATPLDPNNSYHGITVAAILSTFEQQALLDQFQENNKSKKDHTPLEIKKEKPSKQKTEKTLLSEGPAFTSFSLTESQRVKLFSPLTLAHNALENGNLELLKPLLTKKYINVNSLYFKAVRMVEIAALCGDLDILKLLVIHGALLAISDSPFQMKYRGVIFKASCCEDTDKRESTLKWLRENSESYHLQQEASPSHFAAALGEKPKSEDEKEKKNCQGLYPYHFAFLTGGQRSCLVWVPQNLLKDNAYKAIIASGYWAGVNLAWFDAFTGFHQFSELQGEHTWDIYPTFKDNFDYRTTAAHLFLYAYKTLSLQKVNLILKEFEASLPHIDLMTMDKLGTSILHLMCIDVTFHPMLRRYFLNNKAHKLDINKFALSDQTSVAFDLVVNGLEDLFFDALEKNSSLYDQLDLDNYNHGTKNLEGYTLLFSLLLDLDPKNSKKIKKLFDICLKKNIRFNANLGPEYEVCPGYGRTVASLMRDNPLLRPYLIKHMKKWCISSVVVDTRTLETISTSSLINLSNKNELSATKKSTPKQTPSAPKKSQRKKKPALKITTSQKREPTIIPSSTPEEKFQSRLVEFKKNVDKLRDRLNSLKEKIQEIKNGNIFKSAFGLVKDQEHNKFGKELRKLKNKFENIKAEIDVFTEQLSEQNNRITNLNFESSSELEKLEHSHKLLEQQCQEHLTFLGTFEGTLADLKERFLKTEKSKKELEEKTSEEHISKATSRHRNRKNKKGNNKSVISKESGETPLSTEFTKAEFPQNKSKEEVEEKAEEERQTNVENKTTSTIATIVPFTYSLEVEHARPHKPTTIACSPIKTEEDEGKVELIPAKPVFFQPPKKVNRAREFNKRLNTLFSKLNLSDESEAFKQKIQESSLKLNTIKIAEVCIQFIDSDNLKKQIEEQYDLTSIKKLRELLCHFPYLVNIQELKIFLSAFKKEYTHYQTNKIYNCANCIIAVLARDISIQQKITSLPKKYPERPQEIQGNTLFAYIEKGKIQKEKEKQLQEAKDRKTELAKYLKEDLNFLNEIYQREILSLLEKQGSGTALQVIDNLKSINPDLYYLCEYLIMCISEYLSENKLNCPEAQGMIVDVRNNVAHRLVVLNLGQFFCEKRIKLIELLKNKNLLPSDFSSEEITKTSSFTSENKHSL